MMPNNVFSLIPLPAPYLKPRTRPRFLSTTGLSDVHYGGRAIGDASLGVTYQLWTAFTPGDGNIWLSADQVAPFPYLIGVNPAWLAIAFDQSSNVTIPYVDKTGVLSYYWYDSTIPGYRTTVVGAGYTRCFAAFDDNRVQMLTGSDVIIVYPRAGNIIARQQRDRFGVEYTLGAAPGTLVQFGMNSQYRMQFQFQGAQNAGLPPAEYQLNVGGAYNGPK